MPEGASDCPSRLLGQRTTAPLVRSPHECQLLADTALKVPKGEFNRSIKGLTDPPLPQHTTVPRARIPHV